MLSNAMFPSQLNELSSSWPYKAQNSLACSEISPAGFDGLYLQVSMPRITAHVKSH